MPGRTGPRTEVGKRRSSLNRLSHGLRVEGPLPCKLDACYYRSICRVPDEQPERWAALEVGDPCPEEADYAEAWRRADSRPGRFYTDDERQLLGELINADLLRMRAWKALLIATDGDVITGERIGRGELVGPEYVQRVAYYTNRHQRHIWQVHLKLMPLYKSFVNIDRYERGLVESYDNIMTRRQEASA